MTQFDGNVLTLTVPVSELVTTVNLVSYWPIESTFLIVSLAMIRNWKKNEIANVISGLMQNVFSPIYRFPHKLCESDCREEWKK